MVGKPAAAVVAEAETALAVTLAAPVTTAVAATIAVAATAGKDGTDADAASWQA